MKMTSEVVKYHPGFWDGIFNNFDKRIERLQNNDLCYCSSEQLYFHLIFNKFNYIF